MCIHVLVILHQSHLLLAAEQYCQSVAQRALLRERCSESLSTLSSASSPVPGQRPHAPVGAARAPVLVLPAVGAPVVALAHEQRLAHLLAGALVLRVTAIAARGGGGGRRR